jgi:hypothetical protein
MAMLKPNTLAAAALLSFAATAALADTVDYSFTGSYYTSWGIEPVAPVALDYTGSFTVTNPAATAVRPPYAPDPASPGLVGIWAGTSVFYTGATNLSITFSNGATVSATGLDIVVNNTTVSNGGAPYSLGLSAQLYTRGAVAMGMTAELVCDDGSVDDACKTYADDNGVDPLYRKGDATDLSVQAMTGVYFAFYNAPLSSVAAGVPNFADSFGAASGGLGIYSVNSQGQNTTTLTVFNTLSSFTTASAVPEPGSWLLFGLGLAALGLLRQRAGRAG